MKKFLNATKRGLLWILFSFFLVAALCYLPGITGFLGLILATWMIPIPKWQNLLPTYLRGKWKAIFATLLFLVMCFTAPAQSTTEEVSLNEIVTIATVTTEPAKEATTVATEEIQTEIALETEASTVVTTEAVTEASTVATTEALPVIVPVVTTEATTVATTEATTVATTEATTAPTTEATTVATTEATTVATTEATTAPTTEATTAATTEATTVATTEAPVEVTTEPATEATTEATTVATTEAPTEIATEAATEAPTEASTEAIGNDYILNVKTHKFHYPSCGSVKQMKDENKGYYHGTRDDLIGMGYSPCGNCHP